MLSIRCARRIDRIRWCKNKLSLLERAHSVVLRWFGHEENEQRKNGEASVESEWCEICSFGKRPMSSNLYIRERREFTQVQ